MWAGVRENGDFCTCGSNNWETGKLLKIDLNMLRGVWQALNSLSIHTTLSVIAPGASPGETKIGKNSDFWTYIDLTIV